MHTVQIGTRVKPVAASWDELSPKQLLALMPVVYGLYPNQTAQRLRVLPLLLGITPTFLLKLTAVQVVEISWLADFVLDEPCTLTAQLLPVLSRKWYEHDLYGPTAGLDNLTFLEFVFADSYFVAHCRAPEAGWLDKLLAVLYRPERRRYRPTAPDYGGDRRQDFNENLLELNEKRVASLPEATKLAVLTFYRGCRHALEQAYPLVFAEAGEQPASTGGWDQVLREMSGQAFGDFASTGRQLLHQLLAKMQEDAARAEQLLRELRQANPAY